MNTISKTSNGTRVRRSIKGSRPSKHQVSRFTTFSYDLANRSKCHPKNVSDRLGHSRFNVTMDMYSHVTESLEGRA